MVGDDRTISAEHALPRSRKGAGGPALYLLLECSRPTAGSSRHSLDGIDEVVFGRGPAKEASRNVPQRQLVIRVGDSMMSTRHARLVRERGGFVFEDVGSKNGSLVNHERQQRVELTDGDVLELGSTFFLYRDDVRDAVNADDAIGIGSMPGMSSLVPTLSARLDALKAIGRSHVPVLILGETGTGKELVARAVHELSGRSRSFVAVNCGAIPATLVESELFGFRKGAFSGATDDRTGLIRASTGGTLFLDEIGDLPQPAQAALLRVLQTREVLAIGTTQPVAVDLRVVAATHRDLEQLVSKERFRGDLLARLNGFEMRLPPVRERREDLGVILGALSGGIERTSGVALTYSPEAVRALIEYDWPSNIREIEQCVTTAAALGRGRVLFQNLPEKIQKVDLHGGRNAKLADTPTLTADEQRRRDELIALLEKHRGNVAAVAREAGKDRAQIHRWLKAYAIDLDRYRG